MTFRGLKRYLPTLVVAGFVTLSCSRDRAPTAPAPSPQLDGVHNIGTREANQHTAGLVSCPSLPFGADTQVVGPAGGTLHIGPHTLTFPPGALDTTVTIIAMAPSDTIRFVQLYPQGLTFEDAWLTLNYQGCQSKPGHHDHQVAYTDNAFNVLYYVESYDQTRSSKVTAEIQHFSRYAVGW